MTKKRWSPKIKYGIGKCPICFRLKQLVSDHDHTTGYNRGGICYRCNSGLGMFGDNPASLIRAARYLKYHKQLNVDLTIEEHTLPSMRVVN